MRYSWLKGFACAVLSGFGAMQVSAATPPIGISLEPQGLMLYSNTATYAFPVVSFGATNQPLSCAFVNGGSTPTGPSISPEFITGGMSGSAGTLIGAGHSPTSSAAFAIGDYPLLYAGQLFLIGPSPGTPQFNCYSLDAVNGQFAGSNTSGDEIFGDKFLGRGAGAGPADPYVTVSVFQWPSSSYQVLGYNIDVTVPPLPNSQGPNYYAVRDTYDSQVLGPDTGTTATVAWCVAAPNTSLGAAVNSTGALVGALCKGGMVNTNTDIVDYPFTISSPATAGRQFRIIVLRSVSAAKLSAMVGAGSYTVTPDLAWPIVAASLFASVDNLSANNGDTLYNNTDALNAYQLVPAGGKAGGLTSASAPAFNTNSAICSQLQGCGIVATTTSPNQTLPPWVLIGVDNTAKPPYAGGATTYTWANCSPNGSQATCIFSGGVGAGSYVQIFAYDPSCFASAPAPVTEAPSCQDALTGLNLRNALPVIGPL